MNRESTADNSLPRRNFSAKRSMIAAIVTVLGLAGCGYGGSDLCNDACDCDGCSDRDLEECVDEADALERRIERAGCDDQLDDYLSCASDTGYCRRDDDWTVDCGPEAKRLHECLDDDGSDDKLDK